jgi:hypothetical protein
LKTLQNSEPFHTKLNPTSCLLGLRFVPVFLLAGARLFYEKIRQNVALFWFGLRDAGILYSHAVIQNPIVYISAFLETGLAEKIAVCDAYNPLS